MAGQISRLVLAIISKDSRETLERWQFDVTMDSEEQASQEAAGSTQNGCVQTL